MKSKGLNNGILKKVGMRRALALLLTFTVVLAAVSSSVTAVGGAEDEYLCGHVHNASCGYAPGSAGTPCSHVHDESCGYVKGSECTDVHTHDETCGYVEGAACTYVHTHDEACGYCEASPCADVHVHDEACGFDAETGAGCTYVHTHDETCGYREASPCTDVHVHDEACGYIEPVPCSYIHEHGESCGYVKAVACSHTHDESCGYAPPVPGTPCTHICNIVSFDKFTVGTPIDNYEAKAGATISAIIDDLPETLPGTLACCDGKIDIPVKWTCTDFTGAAGSYKFYAALDNQHSAYLPADDPETENINEGEMPFMKVTLPAPEATPEASPAPSPETSPEPSPESSPEPMPTPEYPERVITDATGVVTVSGPLPEGAVLEVSEVEVEVARELLGETETVILFAYDIKIMAEGVEYQPGAENPVTVTITPPQPIEAPAVEVVHIAEDADTGETTSQTVQNVTTTENKVEFEAEGFSVYVVTVGTYTPRVTFSYDDASLNVEYSTDNSTYTALVGNVSVAAGTTLYFKVSSGTVAGVYRDGSTTAMTDDGDGVYIVDSITANTIITIGTAVTLNVTHGAIVIGGNDGSGGRKYSGFDGSGNTLTGVHYPGNIYTITGMTRNNVEGGNVNVSLIGVGDFNVVLSDVTIYTGKQGGPSIGKGLCAPVSTSGVTGAGNINITLEGDNRLGNVSANPSDSYAALEKDYTDSTLIINGDGTLHATGGADSAGIGSSDKTGRGTKNITINSGKITAMTIGSEGAGIGSGNNQPAENIRIYGGNITATGVVNGAGIGGSGSENFTASSGEVYIYGGTINATSNGTGAGIGGGGSGTGVGATGGAGEVHIYGGTINAGSIGGGYSQDETGGAATVNISGGKVTTTKSIGGGNSSSGSGGTANITISGGTITAANISGGHGVGGSHAGGTLSVTGGSAKVDHVCDQIVTTGHGDDVLSYTVVVKDSNNSPVANAPVTAIGLSKNFTPTYGLNDVFTDADGKLYLWLPSGTTVESVTANGTTYNTSGLAQKSASISASASPIAVGTVLTATLSGDTATTWQWQRYTGGSWSDIEGGTDSTYTVQAADVGHQLLVIIDASVYSPSVSVPMPQFTITIPESVNMTTDSFGIIGDLTAFAGSSSLTVAVRSASGFTLKDATANELPYSLSGTQGGSAIANDGIVATFSSSGSTTVPVYYSIDTPQYSGTYTDTLTFTVTFNSGS